MPRKYVDCREYPSDIKCSLKISGEENELIKAATEHAVSVHGYTDSPQLREELKKMAKDDVEELKGKQVA